MIAVRVSRWFALFHADFTATFFPSSLSFDGAELYGIAVQHWYAPWIKVIGRIPAGKIASAVLLKGLIWDKLVVETTGGERLTMPGLRKKDANFILGELDSVMK